VEGAAFWAMSGHKQAYEIDTSDTLTIPDVRTMETFHGFKCDAVWQFCPVNEYSCQGSWREIEDMSMEYVLSTWRIVMHFCQAAGCLKNILVDEVQLFKDVIRTAGTQWKSR
jgi:hypothetical protein